MTVYLKIKPSQIWRCFALQILHLRKLASKYMRPLISRHCGEGKGGLLIGRGFMKDKHIFGCYLGGCLKNYVAMKFTEH